MTFSCKTIKKSVETVITKDKGSKFLGYLYPVKDENEVKSVLEQIKQKYPDATHHCYAYRLGFEGEKYRANDDGEPNGTAGLPIYNQLLSADLTFVLMVVVRYYGGTKLGVSGLIKAYKHSTEETLSLASEKIVEKTENWTVQFEYPQQSQAMRLIERMQAKIIHQKYEADCTLQIQLKKEIVPKFLAKLKEYPKIKAKSETV